MSDWGDGNFTYRMKLTIDNTKVPSNRTDYPMLVKFNNPNLRYSIHGGHVKSSDGYDIVFYTTAGILLSHEIVHYNPMTGEIVMWVKIPTVFSAVDTEFYIYYGRGNVENNPSSTGTWNANYMMVQHCHQAGLDLFLDSTDNDNDAVDESAKPVTYAHSTAKIFKSVYVGEDVRWLHLGSDATIKPTNVTIETWMRFTDLYGGTFIQMPYDDDPGVWDIPYVGYGLHKGGVDQFIFQGNEDIQFRSTTDNVIRDINTWYHLMGTYDGVFFRLFINGVEVSIGAPFPGTIRYNGSPKFIIGCRSVDFPLECFKGMIEEVRVSNIARPTDYAATVYNNTNEPLTFFSVGEEEIQSGFLIISPSYTVALNKPSVDGEEAGINKQLDSFEFWSDNYEVHDDGIASQPFRLSGVETDTAAPGKFKQIWSIQDKHEKVEIVGLDECFNGVYVIKEFSFQTTPRHNMYYLRWNMNLEKVRDL